MIGDHRGLLKALAIVKVIAGLYMVELHGLTMFAVSYRWFDFTQLPRGAYFYTVIKIGMAGTLPVFAGIYLRNIIGPYLTGPRIPRESVRTALRFCQMAFLLEAIRLFGFTLTPAYSFTWNALHFIALSMVVATSLLAIDKRLLGWSVLLVVVSGPLIDAATKTWVWRAEDLSSFALVVMAWAWTIGFTWLFYFSSKPLRVRLSRRWQYAPYAVGLILIVLAAVVIQPWIVTQPRALVDFVNLPRSIFFVNDFDDNSWPFFAFYPVFCFGYFLRGFLFDVTKKKYFVPFTLGMVATLGVYFLVFFPHQSEQASAHSAFTKALFADGRTLIGALAVFYLALVIAYFLFAKRRTPRLDRFCYLSRSILLVYVIHGFFLSAVVTFVPPSIIEARRSSPVETLWIFSGFFLLAYILSIYVSHRLGARLESNPSAIQAV